MDELRDVLEGLFDADGLRDPAGPREAHTSLTATLESEESSDYEKFDAALALALLGDAEAIPTLRRVFDEQFFALSNSEMEYGYAAVALALLGDRESINRIRGGSRVNGSGLHSDMALRHLDAREDSK